MAWLLTGGLMLAVAGCAAHDAVKAARAAMAGDDPVAAARHYEAALGHRPSLSRDESFMAEVVVARRDAAMVRGREFVEAGRFEQAITQFEKALTIEPDYPLAERALAEARAGAADAAFTDAVKAADRGELDPARQALQRSLAQVPGHARAARALRLLDNPEVGQPAAVKAWSEAAAMADVRDWDRAAALLRESAAADAELFVARAGLAEATRVIADAERKLAEGRAALDEKRLAAAVTLLREATGLRPHHVPTADALTTAQRRQAEAQRVVDEAAAALANREFDLGLDALRRAAALQSDHPDLGRLEARIRDTAAAHHVERGRALFAAGDAESATAAFRDALRYRGDDEAARAGLAGIATAQAEVAAADGWWGSALLFHLDATDLLPTPEHRGAVDRARAQIAERAGAAVVMRRAPAARATSEQATLDARVAQLLRERFTRQAGGSLLRLVDGRSGEEPHFAASVEITQLDVRHALVGRSQRSYPYQVESLVPNPHLSHLRSSVWDARNDVERARRALNDRRHAYRDAAAHADRHSNSERAAQKLDNREAELDAARHELSRAESELWRLERELSSEPAMVVHVLDASWPYVVETHEVKGTLRAEVVIAEPESGAELAAVAVGGDVSATDDTIRGGNPGLGMGDDPLTLPSDSEVRHELLETTAADAAEAIVDQVLEARLKAAETRAREAAGRDDPTLALEAEVDAAIVLSGLDRAAGARRLDDLRRASEAPLAPATVP